MFREIVRARWLGAIVIVSVCASSAFADVPRLIHYQGRLRDSAGTAVNQNVVFRARLYDADSGGNALFDETHNPVAVSNGLFNVLIGSPSGGVPDSAIDAPAVYLGVTIGVGEELSPRVRLASGAHAIKARSAEQLVKPNTFEPAVVVSGDGRVGIGDAPPDATALLDLNSTSRGLLVPRMTAAERDAITSPSPSLLIFNTTSSCFEFFLDNGWQPMACGCQAPPPSPSAISGPAIICPGNTTAVYSIAPVGGATSYAWTVPNGFSITSGQSTTSITVGTGPNGGDVVVTANNACGASAPATLAVSVVANAPTGSQQFDYTGAIVPFTIPTCVSTVTLEAWGAQGGSGDFPGGLGARMRGEFSVTSGSTLKILAGQRPSVYNGGGGGSFVATSDNTPLLVAGGGGGGTCYSPDTSNKNATTDPNGQAGAGPGAGAGGSSGNGGGFGAVNTAAGGGGFFTDGQDYSAGFTGGKSFLNGGAGGGGAGTGGFGGGGNGSQSCSGGGGGGYSGGGGGGNGNSNSVGGGGGSYNVGADPSNSGGVNTGHGRVVISW